ncbi:FCP1 homology domain [Dillenia turbinata]|uniref:protein-serine/threonine phosphatase n=1 Tax=Dillenia turbinata TaxID=194707 RepID=A0AAN8USM1_9MAGN
MVAAELNRFQLVDNKERETETLARRRMGKDELHVADVEEGEISDTESIEEISAEDFNKQEVKFSKQPKTTSDGGSGGGGGIGIGGDDAVGGGGGGEKEKQSTRVWSMSDVYKCNYNNRAFASGLYNLAWAQAVQNKPLKDVFVEFEPPVEDSKQTSSDRSSSYSFKEVNNKVIIDDSGDEMDANADDVEKEEGELEEGEIDLDSDPSQVIHLMNNVDAKELENELDEKISSIREALVSVTVSIAEKSYVGVCSRLQNSLEILQQLGVEKVIPKKDALVQLAFTAIQSVHSVFCSMNQNQKLQNKGVLSRLISFVTRLNPPLFTPERMKEMESMMPSLDSNADFSGSTKSSDKNKEPQDVKGYKNITFSQPKHAGSDTNPPTNSLSSEPLDKNKRETSWEDLKPSRLNLKAIGMFGPLLDLHKDHDADSLPSPTREAPMNLFVSKASGAGETVIKSDLPTPSVAHEVENVSVHPYITDAFKAVSTYQQKFARTTFCSNKLPSPTPSEEGNDGDDDIIGEVSSSSATGSLRIGNQTIVTQPVVSPPQMEGPAVQAAPRRNVGPLNTGSNTTSRASVRSRDPRLQFLNTDMGVLDLNQQPLSVAHNAPGVEPPGGSSARKHKNVEEPGVDGPLTKRQRNESVEDGQTVSGKGGWLEDGATVGPQFSNRFLSAENCAADPGKNEVGKSNVIIGGSEQLPAVNPSVLASLPSLLKDIVVNPTMLMNLLIGQQQKLAAESQQKSGEPPKNGVLPSPAHSILGAGPLVNVSSSRPSALGPRPAGNPSVSFQNMAQVSLDESGKIRMKPRDPRRILHNNAFQKTGKTSSEHNGANGTASTPTSKDNVNVQKLDGQTQINNLHPQPVSAPDITRQFTKNLKNIADIMSASQASATPPVSSPILSSQPVHTQQRSGTGPFPDEGTLGTPRTQNTWGDVEHLFEGYDDAQKAAIQRERARRMEEQKKMFAAHKLCLVLDLDHTLLNSAKFLEVDPVHDEILRKKEEQDREKPHRHLFRFPHMGMWTKLRPGIWTFLEKASKLYELHLYTMGNKIYATEMAKVLDPKGTLFAGRVISRGDDSDLLDGDERVPKSKDLEGVLGMESAVVIIDDSVRVWPHNKLNLIVVERYTYFPCSRRQFGLLGPSLLEIDHDERPENGTLASALSVIERIHQNFFSNQSLAEVDVRNILASEQRKILAGCRIVFSRVFPVGEANPQLHPLWQTAEQFGAVCTNQIDEQVTHVVANSLGTDKVNWALSTGRFVVHPGWVEASALLYRRANEQDFVIKP